MPLWLLLLATATVFLAQWKLAVRAYRAGSVHGFQAFHTDNLVLPVLKLKIVTTKVESNSFRQ